MKEKETNEVADIIRVWQKKREELLSEWESVARLNRELCAQQRPLVDGIYGGIAAIEVAESDMLEALDKWGSVKGADYKSFLEYALAEKGGLQ